MEAMHAYDFLPNVQVTAVNNSGHWVTLEQSHAYNKGLRQWLESTVFV